MLFTSKVYFVKCSKGSLSYLTIYLFLTDFPVCFLFIPYFWFIICSLLLVAADNFWIFVLQSNFQKTLIHAFTTILRGFCFGCHFVKVVECFVFSWHRSVPCFSMADDESQWPAILYGWKPYVEAPSAYKLFFLLYLHVWLLSRWNLFLFLFSMSRSSAFQHVHIVLYNQCY